MKRRAVSRVESGTSFRFGEWEIDRCLHELRHRGEPVALQPRMLDVLVYLVENRERVVSREELLEQLWGDVCVGEGSLANAIYQIRRRLGDCGRREHWAIQTLPRRGFRFVAEVEERRAGSTLTAAGAVAEDDASFVGRESALSTLQSAWQRSLSGHGGVVMLHGELGIGKTRTAQAFAARLGPGSGPVYIGRCYDRVGAPAFWPWIDILRALFEDAPEHELQAIDPVLAELVPELREHASNAGSAAHPPGSLTAFRYLDAVRRLLLSVSRRTPLALVLEDLHWADDGSLRLLEFLAGELAGERLLLLGIYRDNSVAPGHGLATLLGKLGGRSNCASVALTGLGTEEIENLLRLRLGREPGPALVAAAEKRTRGNPLFLGAIARDLASASGRPRAGRGNGLQDPPRSSGPWEVEVVRGGRVPDELTHAISTLLGTLSAPALDVLQVAAVMGSEAIRLDVLESVLDRPCSLLLDCLDEAARASVVSRDPARSQAFRFEHVLYREVLYRGLGSSRRAQLHARVGEALARVSSPDESAHLAALAHHFFEAAVTDADRSRAIEAALCAAQRAASLAGWQQVVALTGRALCLLDALGPGHLRQSYELQLLMLQIPSMRALHGYAHPAVGHAAERARQLSLALGEQAHRPAIYSFLQNYHLLAGDYERAEQVGQELVDFAGDESCSFFRDLAHAAQVVTQLMRAELVVAREHLEAMTGALDPDDLGYWQRLGQDGQITCRVLLALVLWLLGQESQALAASETALVRGRLLSEPFNRAYALYFSAVLHQLRGDRARVRALTSELLPLCERHEIELFRVMGRLLAGWASCWEQDVPGGIAQIEAALVEIETTGTKMLRSYFLGVRAQCQARAGDLEAALESVAQALDFAEKHGEHIYLAELWRLQGELLLRAGDDEKRADHCFRAALDTAARQGAHAFELRAQQSRARLREPAGLPAESTS